MSERRQPSDAEGDAPSRFVVGIDLGTTNSAVAYVDTQQAALESFHAERSAGRCSVSSRTTRDAAVIPLSSHAGGSERRRAAFALERRSRHRTPSEFSPATKAPAIQDDSSPRPNLGCRMPASTARPSCFPGMATPMSNGSRLSRPRPVICGTFTTPGMRSSPNIRSLNKTW